MFINIIIWSEASFAGIRTYTQYSTLGCEAVQQSLLASREVTSSSCPHGIRQPSKSLVIGAAWFHALHWFTLAITFSTRKFKVIAFLQIIMMEKKQKAHFQHFYLLVLVFCFWFWSPKPQEPYWGTVRVKPTGSGSTKEIQYHKFYFKQPIEIVVVLLPCGRRLGGTCFMLLDWSQPLRYYFLGLDSSLHLVTVRVGRCGEQAVNKPGIHSCKTQNRENEKTILPKSPNLANVPMMGPVQRDLL